MHTLESLLRTATNIFCYLTALLPIPRLSLLTICLRIIIFAWLSVNFYLIATIFLLDIKLSLSDFIGLILFLLSIIAYTSAITEAIMDGWRLAKVDLLHRQLNELCARDLTIGELAVFPASRLLIALLACALCEIVKLSITFTKYSTPVSLYSVFIDLGTYMRYIQVIIAIADLNLVAENIVKSLEKLVARNKPKSKYGSDIWQPFAASEYEQLNLLRFSYGQLYGAYGCVESAFAWSMFVIIMAQFFFFVCNFFWSVQLLYEKATIYKFLYNVSTISRAAIFISLLCAVTNDMENYCLQIACIICKLAKPTGNKPFNDLVSSFCIQTLHQRVSIRAKYFFVINRRLLGSMFTAIITYSIILIQFLFAEQTYNKDLQNLALMNKLFKDNSTH